MPKKAIYSFTIDNLELMYGNGSQASNAESDWIDQQELLASNVPTPSTSSPQILNPDIVLIRSDTVDHSSGLMRGDTLDRNPVIVDPREITHNGQGQWQQQYISEHVVKTEDPPLQQPKADETEASTSSSYYAVGQSSTMIHINNGAEFIHQPQNNFYQPMTNIPTPTSANPASDNWPGQLGFKVAFQKLASNNKNKKWDFSEKLNKLFIDFNKIVIASCYVGPNPPDGLYVRVLPVYAVANSIQEPVKRCPNHAEKSDSSNLGFDENYLWHLIRVNNGDSKYEEDPVSRRLSVVVPLERPQGGTDYTPFGLKFMCLGSDVGGINRKPLKVIFTLEHGIGNVIGRYSVDVRVCSCPKRDMEQEETRHTEEKGKVLTLAEGLARANSNIVMNQLNKGKKRKLDKDALEEMVMVPVAKADFAKLNEFAEAAMIVRNPANAGEIKAQRKRLLERYNGGSLPTKPEKQ